MELLQFSTCYVLHFKKQYIHFQRKCFEYFPTWPLSRVSTAQIAGLRVPLVGYYVPGGKTLSETSSNEEDCYEACKAKLDDCIAYEYSVDNGTCLYHTYATACRPLRPIDANYMHVKRYECHATPDRLLDGKY